MSVQGSICFLKFTEKVKRCVPLKTKILFNILRNLMNTIQTVIKTKNIGEVKDGCREKDPGEIMRIILFLDKPLYSYTLVLFANLLIGRIINHGQCIPMGAVL